jgi:hypothetical protein
MATCFDEKIYWHTVCTCNPRWLPASSRRVRTHLYGDFSMNCELLSAGAPARDRAQEILAAVADCLFASRYADLAFVDCELHGNRVVLSGSVPSYRLKQVAQALVMRVVGAGRVDNRLAVRPHEEWGDDDRLP